MNDYLFCLIENIKLHLSLFLFSLQIITIVCIKLKKQLRRVLFLNSFFINEFLFSRNLIYFLIPAIKKYIKVLALHLIIKNKLEIKTMK